MNKITIIGLGNYGIDEMPMKIYEFIKKQKVIYVRTKDHPVVDDMPDVNWQSYDAFYEQNDAFNDVYDSITKDLVEKAKMKNIVYAVPGHPMVAESTTEKLLKNTEVEVEIFGGKSFIDDLFSAVQYDPNYGFMMLDGTMLHPNQMNVRNALIVTQVYDQYVAGDVKISLMEKYPDEHEVAIVTGAASGHADVKWVPLFEMDHDFALSNLTSLFVPPVKDTEHLYSDFQYLNEVMDTLTGDDGCPFDKVQTHQSLKRYLIEETYELLEAIDEDDIDHIVEELGDILLQVVFHSAIGKKEMMFDINEVVESITKKMVFRHPHVFGDKNAGNIEELNDIWQQQKKAEGKTERTVKQEKLFADLFMKLYDMVNNEDLTLDEALQRIAGENNETR